jgi:hypothetical protein
MCKVKTLYFGLTRTTYYVVEWYPTREPKVNLSKNMVAVFQRHRRAIIEHQFIEVEGVEDNGFNYTEG